MTETILEEAHRLTSGDRNKDYGPPLHDFVRVTGMMNALFADKLKPGCQFEFSDWPLIMNLVKISREYNSPKRDNRVDGCGYWNCLEMCYETIEKGDIE